MHISWGNEATDTWGVATTVSSYFPIQFVKQVCEAAAIKAIRTFFQPHCCYSRVNTVRAQFITMLTGFRQSATTAAWADIQWQQSNILTALIVCTVISIVDIQRAYFE